MPASDIVIKGAREHNLRDVNLILPRNQLICLTGVSGSGKSSLAFDTLYAEGQRRYVESLSSFARQFLGQMPKPDVDLISGLSPSISISQKTSGQNPRSTVGTITEIYDFLRVLYARVGEGHCPKCGDAITSQTRDQIIQRILDLPEGTAISILAPLIRGQKGEYKDLFEDLLKQGFVRARVDGNIISLSEDQKLDRQMRHNIEVLIDRLVVKPAVRARLSEAVELALKLGEGSLIVSTADKTDSPTRPTDEDDEAADAADDDAGGAATRTKRKSVMAKRVADTVGDHLYSVAYACTRCGLSFEPPSPQLFSFNSPQGMCSHCVGLGDLITFDPALLIPDDKKSFAEGCIETVGVWKEMGRWRRHIYQGVADTMERTHELAEGTLLNTPWRDMKKQWREWWLFGTGDTHLTFTWRGGNSPMKYGGRFEGIIPELEGKHRSSKSRMQIRQLEKYMNRVGCPTCHGQRLNPQARAVVVRSTHPRFSDVAARTLPQVSELSIREAAEFFSDLSLDETRTTIAVEVLKEIRGRLGFLINVGLDYLTLNRTAPTLSGGESQRIRLAGQVGCGLVGVLYILDEPSIGLHPRDNDRLLETLRRLRDQGNTVVVVEHDEDTMRAADHIIDFGPGPGVRGGEVVAQGTVGTIAGEQRSLTGAFLSGRDKIEIPTQRRPTDKGFLKVIGARHNNLKNINVDIPLGVLVCVTGVSGSGKSSLVNDVLVETLHRDLNAGDGTPGDFDKLEGVEQLDKLIDIDQSPIGRTPRSNPATYIKLFDEIRDLYSKLSDAKTRGYSPSRFSFNVEGGRCEACEGNGSTKLEMDFLADIWVTCPVCQGKRFNRETLQVKFKGKSISEVLEMDVQQALELFANIPGIHHKLATLHSVGLDYLKLGQPSPTLSGGEAQRIKLARELVKKSTGKTLYLLDEPTTGLHFADIKLMLKVLHDFVDAGNTVLVVEHNLDVIKTADWIIDLGPEGGGAGGQLVGVGTPEAIANNPNSETGRTLKTLLEREANRGKPAKANGKASKSLPHKAVLATQITVQGARQHNLKNVDVAIDRDKMTVFCGPSGSGKSSLAMDTIYAEGQRRYVESLSSYARQFVGQMQKPQLDHIEGLSPAIAIEQKNMGNTPRSTVGTVTEVYDYFRILLSRLGQPYCPECDLPVGTQTVDQIVDQIMAEPAGTKLYIMAPVDIEVGQQYDSLWEQLRASGYARVRIDGATHPLDNPPAIDRRRKHAVEVVLDRAVVREEGRSRLSESVEMALSLGQGVMHVAYAKDDVDETKWRTAVHSQHMACRQCGRSFEPLTPHNFSFNSQLGWCQACEGLGTQTGANPAMLLRDPKLTLADGAVALWPESTEPLWPEMLAALGRGTGLPLDVPLEQLNARQRRIVYHGTGEQWFDVFTPGAKKNAKPILRYQYKGLYPALEEAARLAPTMRNRLDHLVDVVECSTCCGSRVRDDAGAVRLFGKTVDELCRLPLGQLIEEVRGWKLTARDKKIAGEVLREIDNRVQFLVDVGLEYLTVGRPAPTLSAGEAQRIRLASQLGSGLCGVLYVLDEPTIGLHPRDNRRLLKALHKLRDLGNTLLIVEHDREVIEECDALVDFGPGAGRHGGQIVAQGPPTKLAKQAGSVTGPYLSGKKAITIPSNRRMIVASTGNIAPVIVGSVNGQIVKKKKPTKKAATASNLKSEITNQKSEYLPPQGWLEVINARHNNLRNVHLKIPLGTLTCITGPSGSGKSSLMEDVLYASLAKTLHRARMTPGAHDEIRGIEQINKVIRVDQQPLGNSPSSNPATFTGVFDLIRTMFSQLPEAKLRGYTPRRFSFNVPGGRCESCEGNGLLRIEMHFLPDVWVQCETCKGQRYNAETLSVRYHGQSIADVLNMPCGEALRLFGNIPKIRRILQTLCDVGLDYLTLGQPAPTLSGGEAQRVKLAAELARPDTGRTLYLLDEPTTGLHFDDLAKLIEVIQRLVDLGNTVVAIEHNLDVIKSADWLIDVGPEAGEGGGRIVNAGTPEQLVAHANTWLAENNNGAAATSSVAVSKPSAKLKSEIRNLKSEIEPLLRSHTGEALAPVLAKDPYRERAAYDPAQALQVKEGDLDLSEVGRDAKMPWEADGRKWHTVDRVGRKGEPTKWNGQILAKVVDRIHELGEFAETNWDSRSVVEITSPKRTEGWFFHAITGEAWLLKMKFRTARNTFKREDLVEAIPLPTLNDMHDIPLYSNEPRVKCKNLGGPWQEIEFRPHSLEEIDVPAFWKFLEKAVAGFFKHTEQVAARPEMVMPWKVLGQKWHLARKGFPPGKKVAWDGHVLEELLELLQHIAPQGQILWNNQILVNMMVPGQREPWATVYTKRPGAVDLHLTGPKGSASMGRIAKLAAERDLDSMPPKHDVAKLQFKNVAEVHALELAAFLREHLAALKK